MKNKQEIIKAVVDMFRMKEREFIAIVLTDEEESMTVQEMKIHMMNMQVIENNKRCDDILKINDISK